MSDRNRELFELDVQSLKHLPAADFPAMLEALAALISTAGL